MNQFLVSTRERKDKVLPPAYKCLRSRARGILIQGAFNVTEKIGPVPFRAGL